MHTLQATPVVFAVPKKALWLMTALICGVVLSLTAATSYALDLPGLPSQTTFAANEALYVERWKAVGNLLGGLALIADELEHLAISLFHKGHSNW